MGRLHETGESLVANLLETETWEAGIYQLETVDPVQGGTDGIDNLQAKQLANRSAYLKGFLEALQTAQSDHEAAVDPHTQYVEKAGDTMTGGLNVDIVGVGVSILSLGSDLGVNTRSMEIRSPDADSVDAPFVFNTGNGFKFLIDTDKHLLLDAAGDVFINSASPKLTLKDANSSDSVLGTGFIDFTYGVAGTRMGYIGYASSLNNNFYIRNENIGGTIGFYTEGLVRVHIDENGNMGIGSTEPSADLDVEGTVRIGTNSSTTDTDLQFTDNPNIAATQSMRFMIDSDNSQTGQIFEWGHNSGTTTGLDSLMRLTDSGKLLLGYTVDQGAYKLQVNGAAYINATLTLGANSSPTETDLQFTNDANIAATQTMRFMIDSDNTASGNLFEWGHNSGTTTGLDSLMQLTDSGKLLLGYTVDQGAYKLQVNGGILAAGVEVATLQSLLDGVGLGKSLGVNGYATLPGGLIIQWGLTTTLTAEGSQTITLPIVWPNGGFVAHATPIRSNPTANATAAAGATLVGTNQITVVLDHYNSAIASGVYWIAIGW